MRKENVKAKIKSYLISAISVLAMIISTGCFKPVLYDPKENRILHHVALTPANVDESIRFYRDGIGLKVLIDMDLDGNWSGVFNARSDKLRSIFLGDPDRPGSGIVELVVFEGGHDELPELTAPANGFFLISFVVDIDETLARLKDLGFAKDVVKQNPMPPIPTDIALVRDPDGVWVELIPFAFYEAGANQDI